MRTRAEAAISNPAGINRGEIRAYIRGTHEDDADERGFIVWAERRAEEGAEGAVSRWKQRGYKWTDLLQHVRKIAPESRKNIYLSLQTFCAPYRRAETLWRLNAIGFDIDIHIKGMSAGAIANAVYETYMRLDRDVFQTNVLPHPSVVVSTGRGLQILYLLESLPRSGLPLWKMVGEAMAGRIRGALDEYKGTFVQVGTLDANYYDVTRVLRMPGTYNTAAGRYAETIEPEPGAKPIRYRLDTLRDGFLPELRIPAGKRKQETEKPRPGGVTRLFNAYTLHVARLDDIVKLRETRMNKEQTEDCRRRMIFLYRYWSCFYVGPNAALESALAFNKGFHTPLPEKTVIADTQSAEKAYAAWQQDHKKGYNYRNDTLIKFLEITDEEQTNLSTIISHEEKNRRRVERNWDNDKRDTERVEKKKERDDEVIRLLSEGYSQRKIEKMTGVTGKTIRKISK